MRKNDCPTPQSSRCQGTIGVIGQFFPTRTICFDRTFYAVGTTDADSFTTSQPAQIDWILTFPGVFCGASAARSRENVSNLMQPRLKNALKTPGRRAHEPKLTWCRSRLSTRFPRIRKLVGVTVLTVQSLLTKLATWRAASATCSHSQASAPRSSIIRHRHTLGGFVT